MSPCHAGALASICCRSEDIKKLIIFICLVGMNMQDFGIDKPQKYQPRDIIDGCQTRGNQWMKTVFKFEAKKFINLPIKDFAAADVYGKESSFGLEVGPVCFV